MSPDSAFGRADAVICRYVALFVPDLRGAEAFFRDVFAMDLVFREGTLDGRQYLLPQGSDWDGLGAAGVSVDMLALERDGFLLALFPGSPQPGTVLEIGIGLAPDEIAAMRERVPHELLRDHEQGFLHFDDPFGFRWTVEKVGSPFDSVLPPLPAP